MRAAFLVFLTLGVAGGAAAVDRPASPRRITLNLCATDVTSHEWSEDLSGALNQVLKTGKYPKELEIQFSSTGEPCRGVLVGCYAKPNRQGVCDEQSITRLLQASAWLAAHDAQQIIRLHQRIPLKQVLDEVGEMDFYAALQIVDAVNNNDSDLASRLTQSYHLRADLKDLVTEVQKGDTDPNYNPTDPAAWIAGPIYEVASSEFVALVFGHELAHAMGGCHLNAPSSVERSGWLEKLVSMQARGTVVARKPPSIDEILADECALRVLEQVDAGWVALEESISEPSGKSSAKMKTHGGRWIALDAYAELLTNSLSGRTGYDPESHHPGRYKLGPDFELMAVEAEGVEGYLYPALRLALVATTLHERQVSDDPHYNIVLCESTARQFVAMLNVAGNLRDDNKSLEFADLFGTIVAPGVVAGWRTGVWRDRYPGWSYACDE
jgi:hypothetical protein